MTSDFRVGQGFDIHQLSPEHELFLGGIQIDSPLGCIAHSDGDVLIHALIDAILGAMAWGDIGDHFPSSDTQYKGADSAKLLAGVMEKLKAQGIKVVNVDSTVFLETPKMTPYKLRIRERLAELLAIPVGQVSFKAKTMEKLGAIGHREAIGASVTILVTSPLL